MTKKRYYHDDGSGIIKDSYEDLIEEYAQAHPEIEDLAGILRQFLYDIELYKDQR